MANHWAQTALLAGALAVLGACGDDDSDDVTDKTGTDAGGGDAGGTDAGNKLDGGGGSIDGGTIDGGKPDAGAGPGPDASAAIIAEALDTEGTKVSTERADIVFPLACQRGVECLVEESAQECVSDVRASYDKGVAANYDPPCLDATLDLYSCFAKVPCERYMTECTPFKTKQFEFCGKYVTVGPP